MIDDALWSEAAARYAAEDEVKSHVLSPEDNAETFMIACGLEPTPDAVEQLAFAFLPALEIMCQRGSATQYSPAGAVWKQAGWRAQLMQAFKQVDRLNWKAWQHDLPAENEALDAINFLGFFHRGRQMGLDKWGKWGAPGE